MLNNIILGQINVRRKMLMRDLTRISSQKSFYCYLVLSVWIFSLIAGMYKYIGTNNSQTYLNARQYSDFIAYEEVLKLKKFQQTCNHIDDIQRQDDGGVLNEWKLQGVLLLIRHGDRGPMSHVRGIENVDCSDGSARHNNVAINRYTSYLSNGTAGTTSGQYLWSKSGSFHNFPLFPAYPKSCLLGQLTYSGIAQLLEVGDILRKVYGHQLGLLTKPSSILLKPLGTINTTVPLYPPDEIIIYSTRYRRTFQSAMALMFAFVPVDRWLSLTVHESHSLAFCFTDCACPLAEKLKDQINQDQNNQLQKHTTIAAIVQWIGTSLLQNPSSKMQALDVRDAILSIICHNAPLPCRKSLFGDYRNDDQLNVAASTTEESADLINIDQDDGNINNNNHMNGPPNTIQNNNNIINNNNPAFDMETYMGNGEGELDGCVEASHVTALLSYTNWLGTRESKNRNTKKQGLLRAYGLMRNIVSYMLKIISGAKTKFVLYSGHDRTLQFIISALNIQSIKSYFIPYASRMAFEVYKSDNDVAAEYYFRLVFNGKDVTREIHVCEGGKSLRISKDSRGNKADLCPIENIIRFIHDDYFVIFNATNLKDACSVTKNNEF